MNIETGNFKEETWHHNGPFFPDKSKPNACVCCGSLYWYGEGYTCVCPYTQTWVQDELDRITCANHLAEKMKDGLFGALPGDFTTPQGQPVYKRPDERATTPIVHK